MALSAMLLYPGAGGDCSHHTLVELENQLEDVAVHRRDFAYRHLGRRPPPRAPKLIAEVVTEVGLLSERLGFNAGSLVIGGRSMGGRIASMAHAEGQPVAGLILLSYPLHPPGKPEKLRVDHFGAIDVPCLFISGTRDPFATPDELTEAVEAIGGPVELVLLDGQGHDPKGCDDRIVETVRRWYTRTLTG